MEMSFELQIVLQRLVIPGLIGLLGGLTIARPWVRHSEDSPASGAAGGISSLLGALFVGSGLIVSDLWQRELLTQPSTWRSWEAREPWMWMVWMIPAAMVLLAIVRLAARSTTRISSWSWPSLFGIAVGVMLVVLPQGAGYEDKLREAVRWTGLGVLATVWNACALNGIASQPGGRWSPLVLLAQLGCVAALVLQSYASLGEWVLAAIGVTAGLSLVSLFTPSVRTVDFGWPLASVILALTVLAAASTAVSQFYIFSSAPAWVLAGTLFLPSIVGGVDVAIRGWNPWFRALIAAAISGILIGVVVWQTIQNQPQW